MKWLCLTALGLSLLGVSFEVLEASEPPKAPPPKPVLFDDDLFRRDVQVVSPHIEFLYWTVQEGALDYALKMDHSAWSPTTPSYAQGKFELAKFNWDPGFRLAISYFRAPKFWEVKATYTRFTSRGRQNSEKPNVDSKFLTGTWPQIMPVLSGARSQIHMNYNVFDLSVDRYFHPNPHLRLRVFGAGSVAWINQNWKVTYFGLDNNTTSIRNRWKFIGGGFKMGIMADWFWTSDIYITGLSSAGILLGSYQNRAQQKTSFHPIPADDTNVFIRDTNFKDTRAVSTAQLFLGPSWQKNFCNNRVELFAGYEFNVWLNLQEIYRSTAGTPSVAKETWLNTGMVALHGLSTRLTVDF